jgi:hypothetical protein
MASAEQIRQAILKVAGNPENGVIKDLASAMADAIVALDEPEVKSYSPVKETRVIGAPETR